MQQLNQLINKWEGRLSKKDCDSEPELKRCLFEAKQALVNPYPPKTLDDLCRFKKYKDYPTTYRWLIDNDASYVEWLIGNAGLELDETAMIYLIEVQNG